ncbi:MAG: TetR/AcrR family transcriptional regulator [Candidatus Dormibacteria bacterium]
MDASVGLRDRKKLAARRAIRAAATRLVAERGLKNVTVPEIAAAAEVSVRTYFNYFSSKEDAIVELGPEMAAQLRSDLLARPADEPILTALRVATVAMAERLAERQEEWLLHMRVVRQEPTLLPSLVASMAEHERSLTEAVASRTGTDPLRDIYPALTAAAAIAAVRVAMTHWRRAAGEGSLAHLVESALDQLAGGLSAPPPRTGTDSRSAPGRLVVSGSLPSDRGND